MAELKRYLVFAFDNYYPEGGWSDFVTSTDTVTEATEAGKVSGREYWHVVDTSPQPHESDRIRWLGSNLVTLESALIFCIYVAALEARKRPRNYLLTQSGSWRQSLNGTEHWLYERGLTL